MVALALVPPACVCLRVPLLSGGARGRDGGMHGRKGRSLADSLALLCRQQHSVSFKVHTLLNTNPAQENMNCRCALCVHHFPCTMRRPRTPVPSGVWALSSQSTILLGYRPASVILAGCRHVVPSALLWRKQGKSNICVLRQFRLPNVWAPQVICIRLCSRPQECRGAGDGF